MKAIQGHRYAQVHAGVVVWLFTDDDLPEWCDVTDGADHGYSIQAVDVTAHPEVQPGWGYDGQDFAPPLPAVLTVADYENRVQRYLDESVRPQGYDGILSACSYAAGPVGDRFADQGRAALTFRSDVWRKCYAIMADVGQGKRQAPTLDGLIEELPVIVWPA